MCRKARSVAITLFFYLIIMCNRIVYSNRYSDDRYVYRHVILPKQLLKMIPKQFFADDDSGCLRLLSEEEWRALGIAQSRGWAHYEVHGLCFAFVFLSVGLTLISSRTTCTTFQKRSKRARRPASTRESCTS